MFSRSQPIFVSRLDTYICGLTDAQMQLYSERYYDASIVK